MQEYQIEAVALQSGTGRIDPGENALNIMDRPRCLPPLFVERKAAFGADHHVTAVAEDLPHQPFGMPRAVACRGIEEPTPAS